MRQPTELMTKRVEEILRPRQVRTESCVTFEAPGSRFISKMRNRLNIEQNLAGNEMPFQKRKGSPFELPVISSGDCINYANVMTISSRLIAASKPPGFLGPGFGVSRGWGLPLPGTTTGGFSFGGFLGPSPFCAIAPTERPATNSNMKIKCFSNFITSCFLSANSASGKAGDLRRLSFKQG